MRTLNSESQVPDGAQALAEISKGLTELTTEIKRAPFMRPLAGGSRAGRKWPR